MTFLLHSPATAHGFREGARVDQAEGTPPRERRRSGL
jgi:hypothetical protein